MSKLIINEAIQIPLSEFTFSAVRSQGPGGQNVNKVSSKVILQWPFEACPSLPEAVRKRLRQRAQGYISKQGLLTVTSQRSRHQQINREDCLKKLRVMILDATSPPKPRKPTKPTRASIRRRRRAKEMTSEKKRQRSSSNLES